MLYLLFWLRDGLHSIEWRQLSWLFSPKNDLQNGMASFYVSLSPCFGDSPAWNPTALLGKAKPWSDQSQALHRNVQLGPRRPSLPCISRRPQPSSLLIIISSETPGKHSRAEPWEGTRNSCFSPIIWRQFLMRHKAIRKFSLTEMRS